MQVGIIDLGINNLTSVQRAFSTQLNPSDSLVVIDGDWGDDRPDLLVLPGLGKFRAGMAAMDDRNLTGKVKNWVNQGTKIVGICLGMQLLATKSEESPGIKGLDLISSSVEKLPNTLDERIPHTGWAETKVERKVNRFNSLSTSGDFYFVHSYHLVPASKDNILSKTPFGPYDFVSSVISRNILGVQFHPEKSGKKGRIFISEISQWAHNEN